jgi:predicted metal-dependent HD superfamily phosphohydrolase
MLKQTFIELLSKYTDNKDLITDLWNEIEQNYSKKNRFYHSLTHLENLSQSINEIKQLIEDYDTLLFTLFYHDLIYDSLKSDNEKQSSEVAEKRLKQLSVSLDKIEKCRVQILATKDHSLSSDKDTNYFTDADLSILGQSWEVYSTYSQNVRKEYSIYPDFMYNSGRKKVLKHFLDMDKIFKTDYFYSKFEQQARINLEKELNQ